MMTEPTNTTTKAIRTDVNWSAMSDADRIHSLELEGYVVFPEVISPDQLELIRHELSQLPTVGSDYSENQRGCTDIQWTSSPNAIELIRHSAIVKFLAALFGDDILCTSCHYALSRPGHPGIAVHTDAQPYGSEIFGLQASSPRLVRVLYYLDELTPECSPFKVIPRSHLSLHVDGNPYRRYLRHPEEVMVTCPAGSAAIIHQGVFHGNYPNVSRMDRRMLAIGYRPAWAGPIAEVPDWPVEKVACLPRHIQPFFRDRNARAIDFQCPNRPSKMAIEAPGISPSRWQTSE